MALTAIYASTVHVERQYYQSDHHVRMSMERNIIHLQPLLSAVACKDDKQILIIYLIGDLTILRMGSIGLLWESLWSCMFVDACRPAVENCENCENCENQYITQSAHDERRIWPWLIERPSQFGSGGGNTLFKHRIYKEGIWPSIPHSFLTHSSNLLKNIATPALVIWKTVEKSSLTNLHHESLNSYYSLDLCPCKLECRSPTYRCWQNHLRWGPYR